MTTILNHLATDKPTLAVCMRVSLHLNQLAAPLLYRSLHISGTMVQQGSHPLLISRSPNGQRLSSSKEENLKLVKHVTVDCHDGSKCEAAIGPMPGRRTFQPTDLIVECLRFNLTIDWRGMVKSIHHFAGLPESGMGCAVLSHFQPKTLVLYGAGSRNPLHSCPVPAKGTHTVVAVIKDGQPGWPECRTERLRYRGIPVARMIYIFWEPADALLHRVGPPVCSCDTCQFASALPRRIESGLADSYTIVNGGPTLRIICDSDSEALSSLTFLSKEEYLATHDWNGVFTPKEVHWWLNMAVRVGR